MDELVAPGKQVVELGHVHLLVLLELLPDGFELFVDDGEGLFFRVSTL